MRRHNRNILFGILAAVFGTAALILFLGTKVPLQKDVNTNRMDAPSTPSVPTPAPTPALTPPPEEPAPAPASAPTPAPSPTGATVDATTQGVGGQVQCLITDRATIEIKRSARTRVVRGGLELPSLINQYRGKPRALRATLHLAPRQRVRVCTYLSGTYRSGTTQSNRGPLRFTLFSPDALEIRVFPAPAPVRAQWNHRTRASAQVSAPHETHQTYLTVPSNGRAVNVRRAATSATNNRSPAALAEPRPSPAATGPLMLSQCCGVEPCAD